MGLKQRRAAQKPRKTETTIKVDTQASADMGQQIAQGTAQTLQMLQETLTQQQQLVQMLTQAINQHMIALNNQTQMLSEVLRKPLQVDVKAGENKVVIPAQKPAKKPDALVVEFDDGRTATITPETYN